MEWNIRNRFSRFGYVFSDWVEEYDEKIFCPCI